MDEDFSDWTMDDLRERVVIVEDFDKLCDQIIQTAVYLSENFEIEEETYTVEKTRKVLSIKGGRHESI